MVGRIDGVVVRGCGCGCGCGCGGMMLVGVGGGGGHGFVGWLVVVVVWDCKGWVVVRTVILTHYLGS